MMLGVAYNHRTLGRSCLGSGQKERDRERKRERVERFGSISESQEGKQFYGGSMSLLLIVKCHTTTTPHAQAHLLFFSTGIRVASSACRQLHYGCAHAGRFCTLKFFLWCSFLAAGLPFCVFGLEVFSWALALAAAGRFFTGLTG